MQIFIICACLIALLILLILFIRQRNQSREIIEINIARQKHNDNLEVAISQLEQRKESLEQAFNAKSEALARLTSSVDATAREYEAIARKRAEDEYKEKIALLESDYQTKNSELEEKTRQILLDYKMVQTKIKDLQAKQLAYIQMKQREEQMEQQQDYYRLQIAKEDQQDVEFLREVQARLIHKEAIDKVIWDVYYKPAYDVLMSHLFDKPDKVCGIYRITCITNDKAYIGQSVDIKERFRQHMKNALAYSSTSNKLYQEMKDKGIENFTFEILERMPREQLNEREVYWIDFCKTRDYGLNSTRGGS